MDEALKRALLFCLHVSMIKFSFILVNKEMDRLSSQKSFKKHAGLPWKRQDLGSRLQSSFKRNQKQSSPHTM